MKCVLITGACINTGVAIVEKFASMVSKLFDPSSNFYGIKRVKFAIHNNMDGPRGYYA